MRSISSLAHVMPIVNFNVRWRISGVTELTAASHYLSLNAPSSEYSLCTQRFNTAPKLKLIHWSQIWDAIKVHLALNNWVPNRWIERACPVLRPPRRPALTPMDFFNLGLF